MKKFYELSPNLLEIISLHSCQPLNSKFMLLKSVDTESRSKNSTIGRTDGQTNGETDPHLLHYINSNIDNMYTIVFFILFYISGASFSYGDQSCQDFGDYRGLFHLLLVSLFHHVPSNGFLRRLHSQTGI